MSDTCCTHRIFRGEAWACFLLRMWIGLRLLFAGVVKFLAKIEEEVEVTDEAGEKSMEIQEVWRFKQEHADSLMQDNIVTVMKNKTAIPPWMIEQFASVLPWALIGVGCWLIVGLFSRLALIAAGLLVLGLAFGQMMLPDDPEVVLRGVELMIIALALVTVKHNILGVDNLIDLAIGGDRGDAKKDESRRKKD